MWFMQCMVSVPTSVWHRKPRIPLMVGYLRKNIIFHLSLLFFLFFFSIYFFFLFKILDPNTLFPMKTKIQPYVTNENWTCPPKKGFMLGSEASVIES